MGFIVAFVGQFKVNRLSQLGNFFCRAYFTEMIQKCIVNF